MQMSELPTPKSLPDELKNAHAFDKIIVAFSGGKDSSACYLHLKDIGVPNEKIELWHHDVDGKAGNFIDWEVTPSYCKRFAEAFGVDYYESWLDGGFEREMLRNKSKKAATFFETPDGLHSAGGTRGKETTRRMFPQISPDLKVRWCSSYLKIDVMRIAINNQERFQNKKTLIISGERAEESPARSKYKEWEYDIISSKSKVVVRHRPIHSWKEKQVWEIIQRYSVKPHPVYYLGFGRCSCKFCIFGNANQFASARLMSPNGFNKLVNYEKEFGKTIKRKESLLSLADKGNPYPAITDELLNSATTQDYIGDIFTSDWILPSGAYGESCGSI